MKRMFVKVFYLLSMWRNIDRFLFGQLPFRFDCQIRGRVLVKNKGKFLIGRYFRLNSSPFPNPIGGGDRTCIQILSNSDLIIGDNFKATNVNITCGSRIEIRDNVMLGAGVCIFDTDFHPIQPFWRNENVNEKAKTKRILIENNVFVGTRSLILKGVHIGENSVVGAGSVVTKSIPPNEIWAGNPAKKVGDVK